MATLAESLVSSTSRKLTLRMRPDLSARRHRYHGKTFWVVKEPIGLNYFRFHEEEYAILCMLDGQSSLDDIKEQFEEEFAPQKITFQDLQQFVGMLHRSGLVISDSVGQGRQLKRRRDQRKKRELMGRLANIFAIRFRGIDPKRLFDLIFPYTAWFFHPAAIVCVLLLGLSALTLVATEFDVFQARLPTFHEFFGPANWIWLGTTMALVKVLHEFGHGLSCRYYGGECHEIGVMFLVFTPCLYCNVSDSWMLPSKWQRAFIGAAGMYVEIFLASIATFVWWFSEPGLLNHLALSVMFICSVSTVVFNGNPLLRFDGYYILMDLAEIPNLRQKSTEIVKRYFTQLCLGIEQPENPFLPQQRQLVFGLYTIAAVMYRWVVTFSILYFLNKVFEPYGLKIIGQAIALSGLVGLVVQPVYRLAMFFYLPGRAHKVKKHRVAATVAVIAALVALLVYLPLPFHVDCTLELQPRAATPVFAGVPGRIRTIEVQPGELVQPGTVLARLDNIDLQFEVLRLEGEVAKLQAQLDSLEFQRHSDERASLRIPSVLELLATTEEQLREKQADLQRLSIIAETEGYVFPPPVRPDRESGDGRLPQWSGTPFDSKNQGALLTASDQFCQIGKSTDYDAILIIDQSDIDLVARYLDNHETFPPVLIKLDAFRSETMDGQIELVASAPMEITPASLATQAGGTLETKTDRKTGTLKPISTSYQARVPVSDPRGVLRIGLTGKAKVYTGWQSIYDRVYRYVARTFHFDW
ncbi:MAG: biotin/lipoyl-binding protein [Pirellulaceae bacterium]